MDSDEVNKVIDKLIKKPDLKKIKKEFESFEDDDIIYAGSMILSNIATRALDKKIECDQSIIVFLRDVVNKANRELKDLATKDPLTKLHNRGQLNETFKIEQSRMKRDEDYVCSLLIMDIDHFKKFNDTYGHNAGDDVLRNFSRIITENIRGTDGAFRYGGEEFIIIYSGTVGKEAYRAAKHLNSYMRDFKMEFVDEKGKEHEKVVTFSGGVTQMGVDEDLKAVVERADKLLYKAKKKGRDQTIFE